MQAGNCGGCDVASLLSLQERGAANPNWVVMGEYLESKTFLSLVKASQYGSLLPEFK
jgi:hypothetical protein